jgi:AAA+ ATPase superfamily predicted ATPase
MIGRSYEIDLLETAINSNRAELGIVYGRRRIGKSTLLESRLTPGDLYFEGIKGLPLKAQIEHFCRQLAEQTGTIAVAARDWNEAFEAFAGFIARGKRYVVFDEFPWMASERAELVSILKYHWDLKWKKNPKLTLVLCGSIAQFMVKHVVHSEALHNRKTFELKLDALGAREAAGFFKKKRSAQEVSEFLMVFGGVPKYLEQINPADSLSVNLDRLCFTKAGFFTQEFETIFKEQFKVSKTYEAIVLALSEGSMTQEQLQSQLKVKSSGGFKHYLENLERADFIHRFEALDPDGRTHSKTVRYYLWDEWLRFYMWYMKPSRQLIGGRTSPGLFKEVTASSWSSFLGLSFEMFCLKNIPSLMRALKINENEVLGYGPFFRQGKRRAIGKVGAKRSKAPGGGLQIDILIRRKGNVLTAVECKYKDRPVGLQVIDEVEKKISLLDVGSRYTVERVLIAPGGVTKDVIQADYFHRVVGLEAFLG